MRRIIETLVAGVAASLLGVASSAASMVGMVVGRGGDVTVERGRGTQASVDGFLSLEVGDTVTTGREGGQVLLFDNTRAQLLPGATYRIGRSGIFRGFGEGCVLSHGYRQAVERGSATPSAQPPSTVAARAAVAVGASALSPGAGWRSADAGTEVLDNDVVRVVEGGVLRLEFADGGAVHLTGPCQAYVHQGSLEIESGRALVDGTTGKGLVVGTPTGLVDRGRQLFGVAVAEGRTYVRSYGGRLDLANRVGRRRGATPLTGLSQGAVDETGRMAKPRRLLDGPQAREVAQAVAEAMRSAAAPDYVNRVAEATSRLGRILQARAGGAVPPSAAGTQAPSAEDETAGEIGDDEPETLTGVPATELGGRFDEFIARSDVDEPAEELAPWTTTPAPVPFRTPTVSAVDLPTVTAVKLPMSSVSAPTASTVASQTQARVQAQVQAQAAAKAQAQAQAEAAAKARAQAQAQAQAEAAAKAQAQARAQTAAQTMARQGAAQSSTVARSDALPGSSIVDFSFGRL